MPGRGRRIDESDDWVHQEVALALEQQKSVFPVLVDGPDKMVPILIHRKMGDPELKNAVVIPDLILRGMLYAMELNP